MARRNLDGTYKNNNTASRVSNRTLIARWVEAEVLETKQFVVSFAHAARHITAVVRGQEPPLIPLFPGITFPSDYRISAAACHKAIAELSTVNPSLAWNIFAQSSCSNATNCGLQRNPVYGGAIQERWRLLLELWKRCGR